MQLFGTLCIAVFGALLTALAGGYLLDLSFLLSVVVYSLTGSLALLILSWRRFASAEKEAWDNPRHPEYAPVTMESRRQ